MIEREQPAMTIRRNSITLRAATLEGLCQGLLAAAQSGQQVSTLTKAMAKSLDSEVRKYTHDCGVEDWPLLKGDETLGDLIVYAFTVRSIYFAFLTPDELEEARHSSAFRLEALAKDRK